MRFVLFIIFIMNFTPAIGEDNSFSIFDKNFRRADRAIVTFNTTHLRHKNTVILKLSALHEIGHVFGLGHPAQNCPSFMTPLVTAFNPQSLSPQEHQYINSSY